MTVKDGYRRKREFMVRKKRSDIERKDKTKGEKDKECEY
jgi:hypothetical protein